jgi:FkbM family methyltransferase
VSLIPHKFFAPNGELSEMILKHFPRGCQGYAVDVGASDGVSVNSTYVLEKLYRWTVLSVEANTYYKPFLQANRPFVEMCACASEPQDDALFHVHLDNQEAYSALTVSRHSKYHAKPGAKWRNIYVPVRTVDQLLAKWEFPQLNVLCIDTEGTEVDVMRGCDIDKWKPRVIVVESWDEDGPTHEYVRKLGYKHADTLVQNYVYRRENL